MQVGISHGLEAAAGVRQPLVAFAKAHPEFHVMDDRFMAIEQAMATPRQRIRASTYLRTFIEDVKASGLVAASMASSGQHATIAPAA